RNEIRGYWHTEGNLPGLKFSPSNGVPEFLGVGFGNPWYSKQVYKITLEAAGGLLFKKGDKIFGATSKARAEVARVVGDVLWLIGVQGTFDSGGNEDLYTCPGGTDYTTDTLVTTPAFGAVSGYYCHKMDAVRNTSNAGVVGVHTTALQACLMDQMQDFSEFGITTGKKKVFVTVKDATAGTAIPISGWMGMPIMGIKFKTGTAIFEVGSKLSAKTGGDAAAVIGTIIGFRVDTGTWASDAAGIVFVAQDATARAVLNSDVLTDDHGAHNAAAVADQAAIPAYLNNAVKIYNNADSSGSVQSWNGDVTTFDETDTLTYNAIQRTFDQKSLSVFVKDAGDNTKVGKGTKVKELSFDITADAFAYNVGLLGRNVEYPTTEPAYPGGLTDSSPFGASARTFEIDGSSSGQAAQVNKARASFTWDFAPGKGVVISENYPTTLQPTTYNIIGTLDVQWKNNAMMKAFWNNPSGSAPAAGTLISKRLSFLLDSGDVVSTGYNKMLSIELLGTIDSATLNRDQDGYIQPTTIEGFMYDSTYTWGPARFYVYDATATH
ncbi:MAG: hypothetical protein M0R80_03435, partial [Proteobacteria bacterium]|nr:hypothetical protein [Pseudomonadota bacterium]